MIAWWWLPVGILIGKAAGIVLMAILYGSWDKKESDRQRGNADDQKGGSI